MLRLKIRPAAPVSLTSRHLNALAPPPLSPPPSPRYLMSAWKDGHSLISRHLNALAPDGHLKPVSKSSQLECLLHDAVRIMRPLAPPSRRIVVHPMVISPQCPLVPWAIYDGQWVMESVLCLLDNAFCYGTEVRRGG